jgi:hypothetical protein
MSGMKRTERTNGDSCGCAMGAKFLAAGLAFSLARYGWQWHAHALALGAACWRVGLVSFAAAVVGKFVGIARFRMRVTGSGARFQWR